MFGKKKKAVAFHLLKSCLLGPSFTMGDDVLEELEPIQYIYPRHPHGFLTHLCHHAILQPCAVPGSCLEHGYSVHGLWYIVGHCNVSGLTQKRRDFNAYSAFSS